MKSTQKIVGLITIIAVTFICSTKGVPKPQETSTQDFIEVDGFAFDGPVDGLRTPSSARTVPTIVSTITSSTLTSTSASPSTMQTPNTESRAVTQCAQDCRFRVTAEYNPVCGSDKIVYSNPGMLVCAKNCGRNVMQAYIGPCNTSVRG